MVILVLAILSVATTTIYSLRSAGILLIARRNKNSNIIHVGKSNKSYLTFIFIAVLLIIGYLNIVISIKYPGADTPIMNLIYIAIIPIILMNSGIVILKKDAIIVSLYRKLNLKEIKTIDYIKDSKDCIKIVLFSGKSFIVFVNNEEKGKVLYNYLINVVKLSKIEEKVAA